MTQPCPLCLHPETHAFYRDADRDYLRCTRCSLIFVSRADLLSPDEEKARYDLHENNPDDPGYRHFLSQLIHPLLSKLDPPPLTGLDFGSGPGPTLSVMLEEQGYRMNLYDPFYAPHVENLNQTYDFVTCSETLEHFNDPKKEWDLIIKLVKPGGWLGLMTLMIDDPENFSQWHYIKDLTHVNFFSRSTFRFLANSSDLSVDFMGDNVILMNKQKDELPPDHVDRHAAP